LITRKIGSSIYIGQVTLVPCVTRASTRDTTNFISIFKTEETESSDSFYCL